MAPCPGAPARRRGYPEAEDQRRVYFGDRQRRRKQRAAAVPLRRRLPCVRGPPADGRASQRILGTVDVVRLPEGASVVDDPRDQETSLAGGGTARVSHVVLS